MQSLSPKVSIITVVYNNDLFLESCIKSVIAQDYNNIEYIIIDGGSTDNTSEIIKKYLKNISHSISETDNGIYDAFNKGIKLATGKYIGFLNSDDYFSSEESVSRIISSFYNDSIDVVYSNIKIIDRETNKLLRVQSSKNFNIFKLRIGIAPPHPTFYCKRAVYEQVGFYSTNYIVSADYEMMVRILFKHKVKYNHLDYTTVMMRSGGISNNNICGQINQNFEIIRAARSNNFYTNFIFLILKLPYRLIEIIRGKIG